MLDFYYTYDWSYFLFWARIISGFFSVVLAAAIVVIAKKLNYYNFPNRYRSQKEDTRSAAVRAVEGPWGEITKRLETENPADWNVAILKADALADTILKRWGLKGQTMGERLQWLDKSQLSTLDDLWEAHRIRNEIAHNPEKALSKHMAHHVIKLYENALRELGYIE